ncbi:copper homeostasis protein CutC [Mucilaginibacter koreensis]
MITLEVCANSVNSALAAQAGGAVRVELCNNLHEGGTTPSPGQIIVARQLLNIKQYVLIRPRGGDFLYGDIELEMMLADIEFCITAGCDGIVIGALNADGTINKEACRRLIEPALKAGLGVTFHRAFDMTADIYQALDDVIDLGCERVLTSGGKTTAMEGASVINHLVQQAAGRISIMPGGGISEHNVNSLVRFTGVNEVHASARTYRNSAMQYHNTHIMMGGHAGVNEYKIDETDSERVKQLIELAN